jgi:hypothetical protein
MMLVIILQTVKPLYKNKERTGSRSGSGSAFESGSAFRSGSAFGSAYFFLEAEAVEAETEALRVEAEALKIILLPHHWQKCR